MLINAKSSLQAASWSQMLPWEIKNISNFHIQATLMRMSSYEIRNLKLHLYKYISLWKHCSDISVSSECHYFAQAVSITAILNVGEIPWHWHQCLWGRRDPVLILHGPQLGKNRRLTNREHLGGKGKVEVGRAAFLGIRNSHLIGSESEDGLIPRVQNSRLGLWSHPKQFSLGKPPSLVSSQVSVEEQKVLRMGVFWNTCWCTLEREEKQPGNTSAYPVTWGSSWLRPARQVWKLSKTSSFKEDAVLAAPSVTTCWRKSKSPALASKVVGIICFFFFFFFLWSHL